MFVLWPFISAHLGAKKVMIWAGLVLLWLVVDSWFATDVLEIYGPGMIPLTWYSCILEPLASLSVNWSIVSRHSI